MDSNCNPPHKFMQYVQINLKTNFMKKFVLTIIFVLYSNNMVYAADTEYQLGVDGIACPFCVYGIEKQLSKLEGIERIEIDIQKGLVLLIMADGSTLNEASVSDAVTKAGFSLRTFIQTDASEKKQPPASK